MLPKIDKPLFEMTVPSQGKKVTFRPFLVKEEKILLIAQQGGEEKDIIRALKQILQNCIQDTDFNAEDLTTFDLEYMFMKLRAKSVSNIVKLQYQDNEDEKVYDFEIDLDTIEVLFDPKHTNKIQITDDIGMIMKYPSVNIVNDSPESGDPIEVMDHLISSCVDKIFDSENIYDVKDYTKEEINAFLDDLTIESYDRIREFFDTLPKMYHELNYTNENGSERKIELSGLRDFFTWG